MGFGTKLYYSTGTAPPDDWSEELARINVVLTDSITGRARVARATIADPHNIKSGSATPYTPYKRIKLVDQSTVTPTIVFLGRVEASEPQWDDQFGQILVITCGDYYREAFERKLDSDYSSTAVGAPMKRSVLIGKIVDDYFYSGSISSKTIEESGSDDLITRNYNRCDKQINNIIEELAAEDFWTNETWGAAWRWTGATWDDDTTVANDGTGTPFEFLGDSSDYFYLGQSANPFLGADFTLSGTGAGSYSGLTWQYYNGSWSELSLDTSYDFTVTSGFSRWGLPTDWLKNTLSGGTPPDSSARYWVRAHATGVSSAAVVQRIKCVRGIGYDYYVDDSQIFHYHRRASIPSGGAAASGLIAQFGGVMTTGTPTVRPVFSDYSICDSPKELVTRVIARGYDSSGNTASVSAVNSVLEASYHIVKEKHEYVWGSDMTNEALTTYLTNRANAILGFSGGLIIRAEITIPKYPYYGGSETLLRAGHIVRIKCSPMNIDAEFLVLEVKYQEGINIDGISGTSKLICVTTQYGRSFSPYDLVSILAGFQSGSNVYVAGAQISDYHGGGITDVYWTNIQTGNIVSTGTFNASGIIRTGSVGDFLQITSSGIDGSDEGVATGVHIAATRLRIPVGTDMYD